MLQAEAATGREGRRNSQFTIEFMSGKFVQTIERKPAANIHPAMQRTYSY
ncbi:MAG: hypothetical protein AB7R40_20675 [Nitrospiraceae bacterium]